MSANPDENTETAVETTIDAGEDICVDDSISLTKTISDADVNRFATASADHNPLHLDSEYAEETRFEGRIAHGVLVAGVISAAIARFPGIVVYLSQDMEFRAPVYVGDDVTATVEVAESLGDDRYRLTTDVTTDEDTTVIAGEAIVLIEDEPDA